VDTRRYRIVIGQKARRRRQLAVDRNRRPAIPSRCERGRAGRPTPAGPGPTACVLNDFTCRNASRSRADSDARTPAHTPDVSDQAHTNADRGQRFSR
jgi:hypothetical protein